jgi:signal transduction histidine kinase
VRVSGELRVNDCVIVVEDNGIGFDEGQAERIFGMFERLHGRSEYDGTGIGLAVCRRIAERHGGSIVAYGRPGAGARFEITLPLRRSHAVEEGSLAA